MILENQGSCEALNRSCGCCGSYLENEEQREHYELACDFATHVFCHVCALCQEGRELRRRVPHPGFNAQPVLVMIPPGEQTMGRGAWRKFFLVLEVLFLCMLLLPLYDLTLLNRHLLPFFSPDLAEKCIMVLWIWYK